MSKPSVQLLDQYLNSLGPRWKRFATHLPGMQQWHINEIEFSKKDIPNQRLALYEKWLQICPDASWEGVISALETAEENSIAKEIRRKTQPKPSPKVEAKGIADDCQPQVKEVEASEELVEELKDLDASFDVLTEEVKSETRNAVACGRKFLQSIVSYVKEQRAFKVESHVELVETPDHLFDAIRPCYNFLNCLLLIRLAMYLEGAIAKKACAYSDKLTAFKKNTKVKDFAKVLKCLLHDLRPSHSRKVKIRVENVWGDQEVWLVETLLETLFPIKHPGELLWYEVTAGSVIMCFISSDYMLLPLIVFCTKKLELMRLLGIISLTIGTVHLRIQYEEKKKFSFEDSLIQATLSSNTEAVKFLLQHTQVDVNVKYTHIDCDSSSDLGLSYKDIIISYNYLIADIENELLQLKGNNYEQARAKIKLLKVSFLNANILLGLSDNSLVPEKYSALIRHNADLSENLKFTETVSNLHKFLNTSADFHSIPKSFSILSISLCTAWKVCPIRFVEKLLQLIFSPEFCGSFYWFNVEATFNRITIFYLIPKALVQSLSLMCIQHESSARLLGIASICINSRTILECDCDSCNDYTFEKAISQANAMMKTNAAFELLMYVSQSSNNFFADQNRNTNNNFELIPKISTPLMIACCKDNSQLVKLLLQHNANPNRIDNIAYSALECSVISTTIFKLIFDHCIDVDTEYISILACKIGNAQVLKVTIKRNPSVIKAVFNGLSILGLASSLGHITIVKLLLKAGADPNIQNTSNGYTPLIAASQKGHLSIVEELLRNKADLTITSFLRFTPLLIASLEGHLAVVEKLLQEQADPNTSDNEGVTPLLIASINGHLQIVKALLKKQVDVNIKDAQGATALLEASSNGHAAIVKQLLKANADPNISDNKGRTPLQEASINGHLLIVEILLKAHVDPNIIDHLGLTALHQASINGHVAVVKKLLEANADPNIANNQGTTPLLSASENGHLPVVETLLKAKVDPNIRDTYGMTALLAARSNGHTAIVEQLLKANAHF